MTGVGALLKLRPPPRVFVVATGAGAGLQASLWRVPGSSSFLVGAAFPYAAHETERLLGFDSTETLDALMRWTVSRGVEELTLKELYVATSEESVFHDRAANRWSRENQVSLALATDFFAARGWRQIAQLPWGAPIHEGTIDGHAIRVAAYTEPTLFWERTNSLARSWNVLADGACYASLEDRASRIAFT